MLEVEGERPRFNLHLPGSHECRLETDALLANVSLGTLLGALPDVADCCEILTGEAILVAFHDKTVWVDTE